MVCCEWSGSKAGSDAVWQAALIEVRVEQMVGRAMVRCDHRAAAMISVQRDIHHQAAVMISVWRFSVEFACQG